MCIRDSKYANASQPYSFAREAKKALKESRVMIAECIGALPEEIFFTSGGTESDNWAIKGSAFSDVTKKETITSVIEHHAVLRACSDIEQMGYPVAYLPVNRFGEIEVQALSSSISDRTRLVSIMTANNEIGTVEDIAKLSGIAHSNGAVFHTDAVQAVGHIHIDVNLLGIDMLSASAHKFNGPKGIGFLYIRNGTQIVPYFSGGSQESGMRAGTENVAAIVGMAYALRKNVSHLDDTSSYALKLERELIEGLKSKDIKFTRNGSEKHVPGNISLSFPGYSGETLLHRLDLMGICVSTGAACNSRETQISHVLKAIGLDEAVAKGTIRISLGRSNTEKDVDIIVKALVKIME